MKAGDLYYCSWGYDQTNYDYLVVLEVSKTGKTAMCQRAMSERVGTTQTTNIQKPVVKGFGDKFRMRIQDYDSLNDGKTKLLRGSYPFCYNAKMEHTRLGTFWKCKEGEVYHETDSMCGH